MSEGTGYDAQEIDSAIRSLPDCQIKRLLMGQRDEIETLRAAAMKSERDAARFNAVLAITFNDAHPITQIAETLPDPLTQYELIDMLDKAIAMAAQEKAQQQKEGE